MNLLKTILITSVVTLPLGFYVSTLAIKPVEMKTYQHTTPAPISTPDSPVISTSNNEQTQDDDVMLLKTEVNDLKMEVAALRNEMRNAMTKVSNTKVIGQRETDKEAPRSDEAILAEEDKLFAKQGEVLETDFRQQTSDPTWSSETMALVRKGLVSDKIADDSVVSLECRTRTCRLELANNNKNQPIDFIEFPQHIASILPNVAVSQTEGGDNTTVYYLAKEEFVLPKNTN